MPKSAEQTPPAAEFNKLRVYLKKHLPSNSGDPETFITVAIGPTVSGRKRRQISRALVSFLRSRPKKGSTLISAGPQGLVWAPPPED